MQINFLQEKDDMKKANKIKNYGIDIEREEAEHSDKDWVFGGDENVKGISEGIEFKKYLPNGEVQRSYKSDMMDCASRGPNNILETKFNYLYQNNLLCISNKKWLEDN